MHTYVFQAKADLDDAIVNFIIEDSQPFSVVEDAGFKELVAKLDPTYTLPTREAVKNMVLARGGDGEG